jgi:hypothetical protein
MNEAAGTPESTPEGSEAATPAVAKDDSGQVTVSAQFKKEALENWKPASERANQLQRELDAERAKSDQLARLAYGGGQQATDPVAEAYQQALAQAEFDPIARLTVSNTQKAVIAEAEAWLAHQLVNVPPNKQGQVAELIRAKGYQLSAENALKLFTDPETMTLSAQLEEQRKEIERLKSSRPNGTSPSMANPATASADDGRKESIKMSEYVSVLNRSRQSNASEADMKAARTLMEAVGGNKTRLERD